MAGRPLLFRFVALAAFLVTVALALWLAELRPLLVGIVMAVALLAAWLVEWLAWRGERAPVQDVRAAPAAAPTPPESPETEPPAPEPRWQPEEAAPQEQTVSAPEPPPREPLRPVPSPPPEPAPPPPPPPAPALPPAAAAPPETGAAVVPLPWRPPVHAQEWNLWDLERIAREDTKRDPQRRAELSALFLHLRQFATADGTLPRDFDPLVRESFGGLLERTRRA